jgi:hypothetical protein
MVLKVRRLNIGSYPMVGLFFFMCTVKAYASTALSEIANLPSTSPRALMNFITKPPATGKKRRLQSPGKFHVVYDLKR